MLSNTGPKKTDKEINKRYRGGAPKKYPTRISQGRQEKRRTAMSVAQQNMQRMMSETATRSGKPTITKKLESPQQGFPGAGNRKPGEL